MKYCFLLLILLHFGCEKNNQEPIVEKQTEEIKTGVNDPEYKKQLLAYDVSRVLTIYKDQIEMNHFITELDERVKVNMYKGYEIEYFQFHEFNDQVVNELFDVFFENYNYFSDDEKENLIASSQDYEIHTWNSKKKELAILGEHLKLLEGAYSQNHELFLMYKKNYLETVNLMQTLTKFKKKKIQSSYTEDQKNALIKILGPLLQFS